MSPDSAMPDEADLRAVDGWTLHEFAEVTSTNSLAAHLPPWTAVRLLFRPRVGGRTGRYWVSDEGGLWLLCRPAHARRRRPMVAASPGCRLGSAECRARPRSPGRAVALAQRHSRGRRKLAGILVDRFSPDAAVVGIGLNVANHPEKAEPSLAGEVTSLADLLPRPPSFTVLIRPAACGTHARTPPVGVRRCRRTVP